MFSDETNLPLKFACSGTFRSGINSILIGSKYLMFKLNSKFCLPGVANFKPNEGIYLLATDLKYEGNAFKSYCPLMLASSISEPIVIDRCDPAPIAFKLTESTMKEFCGLVN